MKGQQTINEYACKSSIAGKPNSVVDSEFVGFWRQHASSMLNTFIIIEHLMLASVNLEFMWYVVVNV